jgi:hypothetical protein
MPLDTRQDLPATSPTASRSVRVDINARGGWDIDLPGQADPVTCETLDDAQRVAYLWAARRSPCELIVHDAYHRVLHRELINWTEEPASGHDRR